MVRKYATPTIKGSEVAGTFPPYSEGDPTPDFCSLRPPGKWTGDG
jgi:hypothetical protein